MFEYDKIFSNKISRKYVNDFILLAAIFIISLLLYFIFSNYQKQGEYVNIETQYGEANISLEDEGYYAIEIKEDSDIGSFLISDSFSDFDKVNEYVLLKETDSKIYGDTFYYNIIYINNMSVEVVAANCPDLICSNTKPVHTSGRSIICLPHKLVIMVDGVKNNSEEPDAVTY